jgi:hypothetical protein
LALMVSSDGNHWPQTHLLSLPNTQKSKGAELMLYGRWVGGTRSRNGFRSRASLSTTRAWKSHRMLWQVPEQVWKLCGKIKDWCPKISMHFSCLHLPRFTQKKTGNLTFCLPLVIRHVRKNTAMAEISNWITPKYKMTMLPWHNTTFLPYWYLDKLTVHNLSLQASH